MKKTLATITLLTVASPVFGADASIDLNNDVAHFAVGGQPNPKALRFDASLYHHEDGTDYVLGGVSAGDRMSNLRDVEFSIGGAAGYLDAEAGVNGGFIALSMAARYFVPDVQGVTLTLSLDHAPDVVSTGDVDGYDRFAAEGAYRVVPNGEIYGGYRKIRFDVLESVNATFDEGIYAGFRFKY
jgi:hypothetical protein